MTGWVYETKTAIYLIAYQNENLKDGVFRFSFSARFSPTARCF
jgi:hypothetical protein